MLGQVAIPLCLLFSGAVWWHDIRTHPQRSAVLWLPTFWLLILGSHPVSWWLGTGRGGSDLEGNAFDMVLYVIQIIAAVLILARRPVRWAEYLRANLTVLLFYAFLAGSILWADYPFSSFKRWVKDIGAVPVLLLMLTDVDPIDAMEAVFMRCANLLLPLSFVFAKYFPELGRTHENYGAMGYTGVTSQKNCLGEIILIFALIIVFRVLKRMDESEEKWWYSTESHLDCGVLAIGLWLLWLCDSQTAVMCLIVGFAVLTSYRLPVLRANSIVALIGMFIAALAALTAESVFHVSQYILALIGRNPTLTNRTEIWHAVLQQPTDPLFGTGYLMFWDKFSIDIQGHELVLKTAHNGYLEIYLDGGWIGIGFLILMLGTLGFQSIRAFLVGGSYGRLRLAFFLIMLAYNYSESMYARRSPLWFTFLLFCLEPPQLLYATVGVFGDSEAPEAVSEFQRGHETTSRDSERILV